MERRYELVSNDALPFAMTLNSNFKGMSLFEKMVIDIIIGYTLLGRSAFERV